MPWKILANPASYYGFINTVATLLGPMTGIYMVVYMKMLKTDLNIVDLYRKDGGRYFYNSGWNAQGLVILIVATLFVLSGNSSPRFLSYMTAPILSVHVWLQSCMFFLTKTKVSYDYKKRNHRIG